MTQIGKPAEPVEAPLDHRPGTSGMATPGGGWRRASGPSAQKRERRKRKGGGRGRDGDPTVGEADFQSYYGRQIVKTPVWKTPDVPLYLFLGGAAGSASILGAMSEFTDRPALARVAHLAAAGGAISSVGFLIHDLGRPARFLHMLRAFKPTSPLSVGSFILSPFSALTGAAAALHLLGWFPGLRKAAGVGGAVFGGPMATYTAVLISNTATPSWHEAGNQLPFVFAGSGMSAGGGICMALTPVEQAGPARTMAVTGSAIELAMMHKVENDHGLVSEPYRLGRAGALLKAARACTAVGAGLAVVAGKRRWGAVASGVLLTAGSALTRFGIFDAGIASAKDPKYVVIPQRERMAARQG